MNERKELKKWQKEYGDILEKQIKDHHDRELYKRIGMTDYERKINLQAIKNYERVEPNKSSSINLNEIPHPHLVPSSTEKNLLPHDPLYNTYRFKSKIGRAHV